jgi:hypothetical protein
MSYFSLPFNPLLVPTSVLGCAGCSEDLGLRRTLRKVQSKRFWSENREGKRPLGVARLRWEDNIKIDLEEIVCDGVDWVHLPHGKAQLRGFVNMIMHLQVLERNL